MSQTDQLSLFGAKAARRVKLLSLRRSGGVFLLVVDTETTGLHPKKDRIIEIAWVFCEGGHAIAQGSYLLSSEKTLSVEVQKLTGINDEMLGFAPSWIEVMPEITALFEKSTFIVAYNADFDRRFIEHAFQREHKEPVTKPWVDPYVFVKDIDKYKKGKKLVDLPNAGVSPSMARIVHWQMLRQRLHYS